MKIDNLNNIVTRIILPEFSWIDEFRWIKEGSEGVNYWTLEIITKIEMTPEEKRKVKNILFKEVSSLFSMFTPTPEDQLYNILIYNLND